MDKMFKWTPKITALTALVTFSLNTFTGYSMGVAPSQQAGGVSTLATASNLAIDLASARSIPEQVGSMGEIFAAPSAQATIYHVQDAHSSLEAQQNIKKMLEYLTTDSKIDTIFLEGVMDEVLGDWLRLFKNEEANQKSAALMARESLIGGAELFLLDHDKQNRKLRILGVEDPELYRANLEAYRAVLNHKEDSEAFVQSLQTQILTKGSKIFNKKLAVFFKSWVLQTETLEDPFRHFTTLEQAAGDTLGINWIDPRSQIAWPQFYRLVKLTELEKNVDLAKAQKEQGVLAQWLIEKKTSEAVREQVNQMATVLDSGKWFSESPRQDLETLDESLRSMGFDFKDYPALSNELGRIILRSEIDAQILMRESASMRDQILEKMAVNENEKKLIRVYKDYLLLKSLLVLELSPEDYAAVKTREAEMLPLPLGVQLAGFENKEGGVKIKNADAVQELAVKALHFYKLALERDQVISDTMLKKMKTLGKRHAVLITGGFHAQGMQELWKKGGVSFVELTPHLSEIKKDTNYDKVMLLKADYKTRLATLERLSGGDPSLFHLFPLEAGRIQSGMEAVVLAVATALSWNGETINNQRENSPHADLLEASAALGRAASEVRQDLIAHVFSTEGNPAFEPILDVNSSAGSSPSSQRRTGPNLVSAETLEGRAVPSGTEAVSGLAISTEGASLYPAGTTVLSSTTTSTTSIYNGSYALAHGGVRDNYFVYYGGRTAPSVTPPSTTPSENPHTTTPDYLADQARVAALTVDFSQSPVLLTADQMDTMTIAIERSHGFGRGSISAYTFRVTTETMHDGVHPAIEIMYDLTTAPGTVIHYSAILPFTNEGAESHLITVSSRPVLAGEFQDHLDAAKVAALAVDFLQSPVSLTTDQKDTIRLAIERSHGFGRGSVAASTFTQVTREANEVVNNGIQVTYSLTTPTGTQSLQATAIFEGNQFRLVADFQSIPSIISVPAGWTQTALIQKIRTEILAGVELVSVSGTATGRDDLVAAVALEKADQFGNQRRHREIYNLISRQKVIERPEISADHKQVTVTDPAGTVLFQKSYANTQIDSARLINVNGTPVLLLNLANNTVDVVNLNKPKLAPLNLPGESITGAKVTPAGLQLKILTTNSLGVSITLVNPVTLKKVGLTKTEYFKVITATGNDLTKITELPGLINPLNPLSGGRQILTINNATASLTANGFLVLDGANKNVGAGVTADSYSTNSHRIETMELIGDKLVLGVASNVSQVRVQITSVDPETGVETHTSVIVKVTPYAGIRTATILLSDLKDLDLNNVTAISVLGLVTNTHAKLVTTPQQTLPTLVQNNNFQATLVGEGIISIVPKRSAMGRALTVNLHNQLAAANFPVSQLKILSARFLSNSSNVLEVTIDKGHGPEKLQLLLTASNNLNMPITASLGLLSGLARSEMRLASAEEETFFRVAANVAQGAVSENVRTTNIGLFLKIVGELAREVMNENIDSAKMQTVLELMREGLADILPTPKQGTVEHRTALFFDTVSVDDKNEELNADSAYALLMLLLAPRMAVGSKSSNRMVLYVSGSNAEEVERQITLVAETYAKIVAELSEPELAGNLVLVNAISLSDKNLRSDIARRRNANGGNQLDTEVLSDRMPLLVEIAATRNMLRVNRRGVTQAPRWLISPVLLDATDINEQTHSILVMKEKLEQMGLNSILAEKVAQLLAAVRTSIAA